MFKQNTYRFGTVSRILAVLLGLVLVVTITIATTVYYAREASAAPSTYLNFQARLRTSTGSIAPDGNYNLEFKLYSQASGGTALWTETRTGGNVVRVANGYFSVSLGSVTAFPSNIDWGQEHWITMNIGGTGSPSWDGEMNPRLQLTAVPFAFQADRANVANSLTDGTNIFTSDDFLKIAPGASQGTASSNAAVRLNQTGAGGLLQLQSGGSDVLTLSNTGQATLQNTANSTTAFRVLNSAGSSVLGVDTTNSRVIIGTSDTTGTLLVLDTKTDSGDPAGVNGGMYYNSDAGKFRCYEDNEWKDCIGAAGGALTATYVVAANNSPAHIKATADYVADGTDDQVEINAALTAAAGGKVYLAEGTYVASATILIPNNTTLEGAGKGTVIELADLDSDENLMENSDTSTGTGVVIKNMTLDGRNDLNTAGYQYGIYFSHVGDTATNRPGGTIEGLKIVNFMESAILISGSDNNSIIGNTTSSSYGGIQANDSHHNLIANNIFYDNDEAVNFSGDNNTIADNTINNNGYGVSATGNGITITGNTVNDNYWGISVSAANNSVISGNTVNNNSDVGIGANGSYITISNNSMSSNGGHGISANVWNSTISGNTIFYSGQYGIDLNIGSNNIVTGNSIVDSDRGISLVGASSNVISSNILTENGGLAHNNAIYLSASDTNTISTNTIIEYNCTSSCYAINIYDSASDKNYLEGNRFSGSTADAATINDAGTGTIYVNQQVNSTTSTNSDVSDFRFRGSANSATAFQIQNASGVSLLNVDSTDNRLYVGDPTPDTVGTLLVLDSKTSAGDPTGVQGAMYYNADDHKFRCYEGPTGSGTWVDCIGAAAGDIVNGGQSGPIAIGTTDSNSLSLMTDNTARWLVNASGHLLPGANDTYDIGSDTTRVRDLYVSGSTIHIGDSTANETTLAYDSTAQSFILRNATNSSQAFQIQNSTGQTLMAANTSNNSLEVYGDIYSKGLAWTARPSAVDSGWTSQSVAYGNGLFAAVPYDGSSAITSPDGVNWTAHITPSFGWTSVTYGNGLFVAVNVFGNSMVSSDGTTWVQHAGAESNWWTSITYGNGLFVAVSSTGTGNRVMTSPDGITWTTRTSAADNTWNSITYGNGLFVAVAGNGTNQVMTSPDGITWTPRTAAQANSWNSITYGNGLFVAVASSGTNRVMTSPDGITWTPRTAAEANTWMSVTYGNGLFVAVSIDGTNRVMTSVNGSDWTARMAAEQNEWYSVAYGNGVFVAVASEGTNKVMTSGKAEQTIVSSGGTTTIWSTGTGDTLRVQSSGGGTLLGADTLRNSLRVGAVVPPKLAGQATGSLEIAAAHASTPSMSWVSRTVNAFNWWNSITYGNGLFVAVSSTGTGNRVMTSPDGITWTTRTSAADNTWNSITYGNGLFVAVSSTGTGNRVMTSPDGITWTTRTSAADNTWNSITYGNGLFVAVASSGTNRVMTSPDGITWTPRTAAQANNWNSITYGNGLFVAVSSTGTGNRVMTSPDGITWTTRTSAADNTWNSITYGNGLFVAVSSTGTGNRVMTSPDGITWTTRTSAADSSWRSVGYGNGLFVAVGINGTYIMTMQHDLGLGLRVTGHTEVQGTLSVTSHLRQIDTWTARTAAEANIWNSITYGNGLFVAVSQTGNRVMTSPDGITWTPRTAAQNNTWLSVTYGNGLFVAVSSTGTNRVMTSPDGITWTARTAAEANNWRSITYGNGLFVAVALNGTNRIMTSPDGITWTARTAAEANTWRSITYGNGLFVAVAQDGTNRVMTSPDGITWTPRTAAEANAWWSVTYGNGLFVAVSWSGTNRVMTSPDGITWTPHAATEANDWRSVTYGNGLFVAVSSTGTNRVMTSPDGITWTPHAATEANAWWSVTYGNGLFVAVAQDGTNRVMTSGGGHDSALSMTGDANLQGSVSIAGGLTVQGAAIFRQGINVIGGVTTGILTYTAATADTATAVCRNSAGQLAGCTSASRFKDDVAGLTLGLEELRLLQPVSYTWNTTGLDDIGFIAEQVAAIIPQAVTYNDNGEVAGFNYNTISALLVSSVQQLDLRVQDLEARLATIEQGNFTGNITVGGKIISAGNPATAVLGANAHTSATITISGNDTAGTITYTAANTSLASGEQVRVVFDSDYTSAPRIALTAKNSLSAGIRYYVETTAQGFTIHFTEIPEASSSYMFDYLVIQ